MVRTRSLFILGLFFILGATLFPFNFNFQALALQDIPRSFKGIPSSLSDVLPSKKLSDLIANTLLFLPFGWGLSQVLLENSNANRNRYFSTPIEVLLISCLLSFTVEFLQIFLPSRSPQVTDLVLNSLSGLIGYSASIIYQNLPDTSSIRAKIAHNLPKKIVISLACSLVLTWLILSSLQNASNLSNWNPNFPLVLGNELTGNRPWRGYVYQLAISERAIASEKIATAFSNQQSPIAIEDNLLTDYKFVENNLNRETQLPQQQESAILLKPGSWLKSNKPVTMLTQKVSKTSEFTLDTIIATDDLNQGGTARIISLSSDIAHRNFTIAQNHQDLIFRLRTPFTGENALNPRIVFRDCFLNTQPHHVIITYKNPILTIYLDEPQNHQDFGLFLGAKLLNKVTNGFKNSVQL